ncbi:hypothetical protein H920_14547 [Fukomys damarensis]|uniref:Uncharacterized protein n=1 Tax=Fukomys damarensis TaxID=885580 RepID=A0A091CZC1_FUKDA|nr:hypothetical protein H920_14547 [Fukomys damarensis]
MESWNLQIQHKGSVAKHDTPGKCSSTHCPPGVTWRKGVPTEEDGSFKVWPQSMELPLHCEACDGVSNGATLGAGKLGSPNTQKAAIVGQCCTRQHSVSCCLSAEVGSESEWLISVLGIWHCWSPALSTSILLPTVHYAWYMEVIAEQYRCNNRRPV